MFHLNRCIWSATAGGLGSFVVSAAAQNGYVPADCLDPVVFTGAEYHYFAVNGTEHEEGDGVWTTATSTLTRATIRNSSNSGAKVNFSSPPTVFMGGPVANDIREILEADRTYYVRTDGSDSNDGLANTSAGAFLTGQHAWDVICSQIDLNRKVVHIVFGNGTFAGINDYVLGVTNVGMTYTGGGFVTITGNGSSTVITNLSMLNSYVWVGNIQFTLLLAAWDGRIEIGDGVTFGAGSTEQIHASSGGQIRTVTSGYTISGDAPLHVYVSNGAQVRIQAGCTVTVTGRTFSDVFVRAENGGMFDFGGSFSGTFTGQRFDGNGQFYGSGLGNDLTALPGSVAGILDAGGQYGVYGNRRQLLADESFYVDNSTGSDTTGTGSSGAPFATLQHAWDYLASILDPGQYIVTINLATSGTAYTLVTVGSFGGSVVRIRGTGKTNVTLNGPIFGTNCCAAVYLDGLKLGPAANNSNIITSVTTLIGLDFNGDVSFASSTFAHIFSNDPKAVYVLGPYDVVGGSGSHFDLSSGAVAICLGDVTVTGTPAFSTAYAYIHGSASLYPGGTITGAATGKRFLVKSNGSIQDTSSLTTYPGDVAGTTETNGTYNALPAWGYNTGALRSTDAVAVGSLWRGAPVTKTGDFSVAATENWLINNKAASTCTVTLPAAASYTGREIMIQNYQTQTVVSASSNVVPLGGGAAGTAILAATAGKWAVLVSDGTNWVIMLAA